MPYLQRLRFACLVIKDKLIRDGLDGCLSETCFQTGMVLCDNQPSFPLWNPSMNSQTRRTAQISGCLRYGCQARLFL